MDGWPAQGGVAWLGCIASASTERMSHALAQHWIPALLVDVSVFNSLGHSSF